MKPQISIIIPVYKTEEFIGRCLDSIQRQTFQDYEIIVVNDGTPDNAMDIVQYYADRDSRIMIIEHESNKGLMEARYTGYNNANGKYYFFVDSDDTLPERSIEILYNEITTSNVDIVMSGFEYVNESKQITAKQFPLAIGEFTSIEILYMLLHKQLKHNLWGCMYKSELFQHSYLTIPNQTIGEDLILFYQLVANSSKIKTINEITYNYHLEGISATRSAMSFNKLKQLIKVQNFKFNFLSSMGISQDEILKETIPLVVSRFRYPGGEECSNDLDSRIKNELGIVNSYKYLSFKDWIIYFILKKTYICSRLLKKLYSSYY